MSDSGDLEDLLRHWGERFTIGGQPWEQGDPHERWQGYLAPGSTRTLRNRAGLVDHDDAVAFEQAKSAQAVPRLYADPPTTFDMDGLQHIHHTLFSEVWDWAGQPRTVDMLKGSAVQREGYEPGQFDWWFTAPLYVDQVGSHLAGVNYLHDLNTAEVPEVMAEVYNEINKAHVFREGNGRAQREFVSALARQAGWSMDWSEVTRSPSQWVDSRNDLASEMGRRGELQALVDMMKDSLVPQESLPSVADPDRPRWRETVEQYRGSNDLDLDELRRDEPEDPNRGRGRD